MASLFGRLLRAVGLRRGQVYDAAAPNQQDNQDAVANADSVVARRRPLFSARGGSSSAQDNSISAGGHATASRNPVRSNAIVRKDNAAKEEGPRKTKEQEKKITFIAELIKLIPQDALMKTIFRTVGSKDEAVEKSVKEILDADFSHEKILEFCGDLQKDESQQKLTKLFNALITEMSHKLIDPENQKALLNAALDTVAVEVKSSAAGDSEASQVTKRSKKAVVLESDKNQNLVRENLVGNPDLLKTISAAYLHCASKETVMNLEALGTIFSSAVIDQENVINCAQVAAKSNPALMLEITQKPPLLGQLIMAHYGRELGVDFAEITSVRDERSSSKKEAASEEVPSTSITKRSADKGFSIKDIVCDQETGKIKECKVLETSEVYNIEKLVKNGQLVEIGV